MKLSSYQVRLFAAYDVARIEGGAMTDEGWTSFEALQVPQGWTPGWSVEWLEQFARYGSEGGKARARKLSPERRSEIARLAGSRKGKHGL